MVGQGGTSNGGGTLGPGQYSSATDASDADPINLMWLAVQSTVGQCPAAVMGTFAADLGSWTTFYVAYKNAGSTLRAVYYPQLDSWQSLVGSYGDIIRKACPSLTLPANFPEAGLGVKTSQELAALSAWASDVASDLGGAASSALVWGAVAAGGVGAAVLLFYVLRR